MKKSFRNVVNAIVIAVFTLGGGFTSCYDDSKIWSEIKDINTAIDELQSELESEVDALKALIDALEDNVYVTDVTEIKEGDTVTGYTINLSKGQAITIYHGKNGANGTNGKDGSDGKDGQDGTTPTISAVLEDGVYYWAVNGEILEVDGKKMPVYEDADVPQFKFEDGTWYISVEEGEWSPLASSTTGCDCTFTDVKYDDTSITFVLSGGTEITLPREAVFKLEVDASKIAILPQATVKVAYTITGATETTTVYAIGNGGYEATVEAAGISEGVIVITAPDPEDYAISEGKVVVFAGDNTKAAMQVLSFEDGVLTLVSDTYEIGSAGGTVEIPVTTNLDYEVSVPEDVDWITYTETKAVREETIVLNVAANTAAERSATVSLTVDGVAVQTVSISQQTAGEPKFSIEDIIGKWTVSYGTAGSTYEWVFTASDDESKGNVCLDNIFGKSGKPVYATFDLYTGVLTIYLRQQCKDDYGYDAWLCTSEDTESVSYTFNEDGTFGEPTATIAYAWFETSSASKTLADVSGVKVDASKPAVGNYYYSDGTQSGIYDSSKTLVGIIAWLGDVTATDPALKAAFPECTTGLAVAVSPMDNLTWQTNAVSVADWQAANLTGYTTLHADYSNGATNLDNCLGYNNTQVLKAFNEANPDNKADIYEALVTFAEGTPAPEGTSGWYIPSAKEVSYIIYGNNTNAFYATGTTNLSTLNTKITDAGLTKITYSYFASSTETGEANVYGWSGTYLDNPSKAYMFTLCPVFAF